MAFRAQFLNIIKTLIDNEISPSGSNLDKAHVQKVELQKVEWQKVEWQKVEQSKGITIKR